MKVAGKTALITGAGSGIGRALARALAEKGGHLALVDVDRRGLSETVDLLPAVEIRVSEHPLDLRDRAATKALLGSVLAHHPSLDLLVNNAGVGLDGEFAQVSEADFDWVMDINFHAVVRLTRLFLPHLQQRPEAMIVNMSSLFGLIAPPGQAAYAASKFAVRGFSNALRHELHGSPVGVCAVHPGGVATNIAKNARRSAALSEAELREKDERMKRLLRLPAAKAAKQIVRGIERDKARILVGVDAKFISLVERIAPVRYIELFRWLAEVRGK